jgi:hypothetical protein
MGGWPEFGRVSPLIFLKFQKGRIIIFVVENLGRVMGKSKL